jgi:hypothetical protein
MVQSILMVALLESAASLQVAPLAAVLPKRELASQLDEVGFLLRSALV